MDYYTEDDYLQTYRDSETYDDYQEKIGSQGLDHNLAHIIWGELTSKYSNN
jgi:hypothetical protein